MQASSVFTDLGISYCLSENSITVNRGLHVLGSYVEVMLPSVYWVMAISIHMNIVHRFLSFKPLPSTNVVYYQT